MSAEDLDRIAYNIVSGWEGGIDYMTVIDSTERQMQRWMSIAEEAAENAKKK